MFVMVLIIAAIIAICVFSSKQKKEKVAQAKERLMDDTFILASALDIAASVGDLKNASVKVLRTGGCFYLLFNGGSVYYETRWVEGKGENSRVSKNTQCILDRLDEGKNPLSEIEDIAFAEIVKGALDKVSWMSVTINGREIRVSKAQGAVIPEA